MAKTIPQVARGQGGPVSQQGVTAVYPTTFNGEYAPGQGASALDYDAVQEVAPSGVIVAGAGVRAEEESAAGREVEAPEEVARRIGRALFVGCLSTGLWVVGWMAWTVGQVVSQAR